jgi:branched-chain amino acid aminotransferase
MKETAYLNGRFLPLNEASIPVNDAGFLYGYGCYETLRGYNGRFFRFDAHLDRFSRTAAELRLPLDVQMLQKVVPECLRRSELKDARVRITLSGGAVNLSSTSSSVKNPTLLVTAANYTPYSAEAYEKGFRVIIARATRNSQSILPAHKTTCFLESLLARRQALSAGADDALLLNESGLLAEASSSNVFIVSGGIVKTPRLGSGLLPGVTRGVLFEMAKHNGLNVLEADILLPELMAAEEVFLTNSMIEIMPVTKLEDKAIGSGKPGPLTRKIIEAYKTAVSQETG